MKNRRIKPKILGYGFLKKNRRADIPITILVLGVIAICGLAILSFLISDKVYVVPSWLGLEVFEQLHADVEKFEFYKNLGFPDEEARQKLEISSEINYRVREKYSLEGSNLVVRNKTDPSEKRIKIVEYIYVP